MSERDIAKAILTEITSAPAIDAALETWGAVAELPDRDLLTLVVGDVAAFAIGNVLARRSAHTADVERARREERELCARHIEARAIVLRDYGPRTPEGLLTAIAGAQVGALLDAAASLRLDAVREYRPNSAHRPGGVGGSRPEPWDGSMLAGTNPGDTPAGTGKL